MAVAYTQARLGVAAHPRQILNWICPKLCVQSCRCSRTQRTPWNLTRAAPCKLPPWLGNTSQQANSHSTRTRSDLRSRLKVLKPFAGPDLTIYPPTMVYIPPDVIANSQIFKLPPGVSPSDFTGQNAACMLQTYCLNTDQQGPLSAASVLLTHAPVQPPALQVNMHSACCRHDAWSLDSKKFMSAAGVLLMHAPVQAIVSIQR